MLIYYTKLRYYLWAWVLPIFIPFIVFYFSRKDSLSDSIFYTFLIWIAFVVFKDQFQPEFLKKTTEIVNRTNELFDSSKHFLYIVTPYFDAGDNRLKSIIDAQKNGCKVTLLVRQPSRELKKLSSAGCKILIHPRLHSKLYLSEKEGLMTSMNLLDFSKSNSREIGILTTERKMLNQFKDYIEDLTQKPIVPKKSLFDMGKDFLVNQLTDDEPTPQPDFQRTQPTDGYCIRCSDSIPFSMKSPYCKKCYKSWNKYKNKDYGEEFCHQCSKEWDTSFKKPICLSCFKS